MKFRPSFQATVVVLLLASGAVILIQWRALTKLRQEMQTFQGNAAEGRKIRDDNAELTRTRAGLEKELERMRSDNSELLKLRGDIARLREQAKELEGVRVENRQLRGEKAAQAASVAKAPEQEGIVQQQWEKIELDDSMAAAVALRAIPLLESGENQKAMDFLAKPIGMYHRVYKARNSTAERSNLLARIEEAARKYPVIARELEREVK